MKLKNLTVFLYICIFAICVNGMNQDNDFEKEFEEKYQAWKEYISQPEIALLSYSGPRFECQEFEEIIKLGIPALPFIIKKMEAETKRQFLWKAFTEFSKIKIDGKYDKVQNKVIFPDYPEWDEKEQICLYWWYEGYKKTDSLFKKYYTLYVQSKKKSIFFSQKSTRYYYFKIRDLGIQVIPLIIETAKKGDDDLLQLLPHLTDKNISDEKLSKTKSREEKVKYCEEWWEENKEDWTIPFGD